MGQARSTAAASNRRASVASKARRMLRTSSGKVITAVASAAPLRGEGEMDAESLLQQRADGTAAAEQQQQQKAHQHRRQDDGKMHQSVQMQPARKAGRDRRKATAMANGSDSSTAPECDRKAGGQDLDFDRRQHSAARPASARPPAHPLRAPAHPAAGGSGHWRRQKWRCAKNPGLQRPAPSGAPGHPLRRGPADNVRAAPLAGSAWPGARAEIRPRPRIAAQHPVESGLEEQMRADQGRSGIARQAQHRARERLRPNQVGLPGRTAILPTNISSPSCIKRRPRHDRDRPTDAPPTSTRSRCPPSPSSAARAMAADIVFFHGQTVGRSAPASHQAGQAKGAGIEDLPRSRCRAGSAPVHRRWRGSRRAAGRDRQVSASPAAAASESDNAIELAPCFQQQLCRAVKSIP